MKQGMTFQQVSPSMLPVSLLLEADPSEASIQSYLNDSWCYSAFVDERVVGACVVKPLDGAVTEIFNVTVVPDYQGHGIGSAMLSFVIDDLQSKKVTRIELGTGTFGYQLTFYQRLGFRVDSVIKNHFLDQYPEPIFESGIQHKDMLRLYIQFS